MDGFDRLFDERAPVEITEGDRITRLGDRFAPDSAKRVDEYMEKHFS